MGEDIRTKVERLTEVHHLLQEDTTNHGYVGHLVADGWYITNQLRRVTHHRTTFWFDLTNFVDLRGPFLDKPTAMIIFEYVDPVEDRHVIHELYRSQWEAETHHRN